MEMGSPMSWRMIPERYGLIGTTCEKCGTNYFPAREICKTCRRKGKIVQMRYSGKGKIYSYSLVTSPPRGFELEAPYHIAIIELAEGPRITGQLVETEGEDVKIGLPVSVVFRRIQASGEEGLIHYGFKFKIDKKPR